MSVICPGSQLRRKGEAIADDLKACSCRCEGRRPKEIRQDVVTDNRESLHSRRGFRVWFPFRQPSALPRASPRQHGSLAGTSDLGE
jgi:hypothetical protein